MKYKGMTYTVRKDGRLMKKKQHKGHTYYLYDTTEQGLYNQYVELNYNLSKDLLSSETILFKDYAKKWLKLNSSGKADATIREYKYIINNYLIDYFGNIPIKKITRENIKNLQSDLLEGNHIELAHKCIRYMRTICNEAIADDYLVKNPCLNIKEPKLVHKEKTILTDKQDKMLLNSENKYASFFRIIRYTGMRREEIAPLTIHDVDLKNKTISINKAVSYTSNQPKLKETKNRKPRIVPILDIVYDDVCNVINQCKSNKQELLFVKQTDGKMLSQEAIQKWNDSICRDLGFKFTPHQLRHCYCTMLYYSGIKIKEAQNLMGHSSAKMVYDLYAHLDAQKEDVSSKINEYLMPKRVVKKVVKYRRGSL